MYPDSAAALLRCLENGVGMSFSPSRSGRTSRLEATSPWLRVGDYPVLAGSGPARRSVPCSWCGENWQGCDRIVHVPYVVERGEDGVWCASAQLRPGAGAVGDGPTAEAAVADLRGALEALLA